MYNNTERVIVPDAMKGILQHVVWKWAHGLSGKNLLIY